MSHPPYRIGYAVNQVLIFLYYIKFYHTYGKKVRQKSGRRKAGKLSHPLDTESIRDGKAWKGMGRDEDAGKHRHSGCFG
jgi:hypothetical protein